MVRYLVRRVGLSALVVAGVVCLTFLITRVIPGDPAANWAGPRATPAEIAQARHALGFDRPLILQIATYFKGILTGDWGVSIHTHRPVLSDILSVFPPRSNSLSRQSCSVWPSVYRSVSSQRAGPGGRPIIS